MTPPRSPDPVSAAGACTDADYDRLCREIAETQGIINLAEARMVTLTAEAVAMGVSGGTNLPTKAWLAWRAGISPERAGSFVKIAERSEQLPHTMEALGAGALTVDQAAVIARHIPARYEESAARVAQSCTVSQLRQTLPHYRDRKPAPDGATGSEGHGHVSSRYDETGYHLRFDHPDAAVGAVVDQALKAMREDLRRQAAADTPGGCEPQPVYAADAVVALAETALAAGEAQRPGTDRYLVHAHLEAGPAGLQLMTHLGIPLPDAERRHILCDTRLRGLVHNSGTGAPIGCGRTTRTINRRLRRAIEHRDRGCCTVPGCGATSGLEIHHIWHWEDGGPTETWNLITLCRHHHRSHHHGTLGIEGNADHPRHTTPGVIFTNRWGHPLDPTGTPTLPPRREPGTDPAQHLADNARRTGTGTGTHTYTPPTGERLDRSGFHLNETDPPPPKTGDTDEPDPPPEATGQQPAPVRPAPNGPTSDRPIDPTRAGPDAS